METAWITTSSTRVESVVNSFIAACDDGFVPDRLYHMITPEVEDTMEQVQAVAAETATAYGGDGLEIRTTELQTELDFESIHSHVKAAVDEVQADGGELAVDITPGRKFMTAIAFAAGMRYGADHVYYLYLDPREYGLLYPELPRTGVQLYDFTEIL